MIQETKREDVELPILHHARHSITTAGGHLQVGKYLFQQLGNKPNAVTTSYSLGG